MTIKELKNISQLKVNKVVLNLIDDFLHLILFSIVKLLIITNKTPTNGKVFRETIKIFAYFLRLDSNEWHFKIADNSE